MYVKKSVSGGTPPETPGICAVALCFRLGRYRRVIHAQEMEESVTSAHIKTFVTDFSLDLGLAGRAAIQTLVGRAAALMGKSLPPEGLFLR